MDNNTFFSGIFLQGLVSGLIAGLVATIAGVVIAVPWALKLDRRTGKANKDERRRALLKALAATLDNNLCRLHLIAERSENIIVDRLDLTVLDSTATLKYDLLNDFQLAGDLDALRCQMQDLNIALELWRNQTITRVTSLYKMALHNQKANTEVAKYDFPEEMVNHIVVLIVNPLIVQVERQNAVLAALIASS